MHILLVSVGTGGDTLPFIAWGQVLQARGYDVTVLGNGAYRKVADERGVPFVELISADEHQRRCAVRDKSRKAWTRGGIENMLADVRLVYDAIGQHRRPETVVAANMLCMGARLAQEQWNIPVATTCYARLLYSMSDPMTRVGRRTKLVQGAIRLLVRGLTNLAFRSGLNKVRKEVGLPPLSQPVGEWWHSPTRVIGFFPEWFATPQPDWPPNVTPAGFAIGEVSSEPPLSPAVEEFLAAGPPPLVFSYSTALSDSAAFHRTAIEIAKQLDHRAILLSPPEELTRDLPATILAAPAMSHLRLFPRARLAVHHAGLGSTAAALASGIPQFHVPCNMDQPDNAQRCQWLGVSDYAPSAKFQAARVVPILQRLLSDPAVTTRSRELAEKPHSFDGLTRASDVMERLAGG